MKCKICKKDVIIPRRAYLNLDTYKVGGSVLIASECCGVGYRIKMNISYSTTLHTGKEIEDDWGTELLKPKEK